MIQMSGTIMDGLLSTRPAGELNVWCCCSSFLQENVGHIMPKTLYEVPNFNSLTSLHSFSVMCKQGLIPAVP